MGWNAPQSPPPHTVLACYGRMPLHECLTFILGSQPPFHPPTPTRKISTHPPTYRAVSSTKTTNLPCSVQYKDHQPTVHCPVQRPPTYRALSSTKTTNLPCSVQYKDHQPTVQCPVQRPPTYRAVSSTKTTNLPCSVQYKDHQPTVHCPVQLMRSTPVFSLSTPDKQASSPTELWELTE